MPVIRYHPYYKYNGATLSDPFREELSDEQATKNIQIFFGELRSHFEDVAATLTPDGEGSILISSELAERDCDERVKRCLNSLDLFAAKSRLS